MPDVYFVAVHNVTDPEQLKQYATVAAGSTLGSGQVVAVDEAATTLEGEPRTRMVIIRFPSREAALEWYESESYQKALPLRLGAISDHWGGLATAFG